MGTGDRVGMGGRVAGGVGGGGKREGGREGFKVSRFYLAFFPMGARKRSYVRTRCSHTMNKYVSSANK